MNKAIFLDRDGTINVDHGYVHKIEDWEFIDGVIEGLKILYSLGYKLIVISNQSAIARGYCKKEDVDKLFDFMKEELKKNGVEITDIYYCPHLTEDCNCRKPKLGLFYKAAEQHNIDFNLSYAIGDSERDLAITEKENVQGILINENGQIKTAKNEKIIYAKNLLEAAKYIQKNDKLNTNNA